MNNYDVYKFSYYNVYDGIVDLTTIYEFEIWGEEEAEEVLNSILDSNDVFYIECVYLGF